MQTKPDDNEEVDEASPANPSTDKPEVGQDVPLSEAFQHSVLELLKGCSKQECDFVEDLCRERMNEIYDEEHKDDEDTIGEYNSVKEQG